MYAIGTYYKAWNMDGLETQLKINNYNQLLITLLMIKTQNVIKKNISTNTTLSSYNYYTYSF